MGLDSTLLSWPDLGLAGWLIWSFSFLLRGVRGAAWSPALSLPLITSGAWSFTKRELGPLLLLLSTVASMLTWYSASVITDTLLSDHKVNKSHLISSHRISSHLIASHRISSFSLLSALSLVCVCVCGVWCGVINGLYLVIVGNSFRSAISIMTSFLTLIHVKLDRKTIEFFAATYTWSHAWVQGP